MIKIKMLKTSKFVVNLLIDKKQVNRRISCFQYLYLPANYLD